MNVKKYNSYMPQVTGQEDEIVAQGLVMAMTIAVIGYIKGHMENDDAQKLVSIALLAVSMAFMVIYYS